MGRPHLKPPRRFFYGHAPVRHGDADWRCKCGERLVWWRLHEAGDGTVYRIPSTGKNGAVEAMRIHRAKLWITWNGQL